MSAVVFGLWVHRLSILAWNVTGNWIELNSITIIRYGTYKSA